MFRGICIFTIMLQVFGATTGKISALENMDYSDTSVYVMGDSLIEGKGNDYVGIGDLLEKRGASVVIDVSEHGDVVCNVPYSNEYKRSNFYKQLEEVEKSVSEKGYDENTIVVVDGGTNDLLKYYSENVQGKDTHFNLTLWENNGSAHDLESSLRNFLDTTVHMYGNDDSTQSYQVPIFFLMPLTRNQVTGNDLNAQKYSYSIIGREHI